MSDDSRASSTTRVAHLDEIAPIEFPSAPEGHHWIPVRHALGVQAFGVGAYTGVGVGDEVIGEHTESDPEDPQHQELYFVVRGRAAFVVDGREIDAPTGTFVFVEDPASLRGATAAEPGTTVLAMGARPGEAYVVSDWERKYVDA